MVVNAGINPQIAPQLTVVVKIEADFTEESFAEYMKAAFKTAQAPQAQQTPLGTAKNYGEGEEEISASYLLSMTKQLTIDNAQLTIEKPQETTPVPEVPEFAETPEAPQLAQNPENPQAQEPPHRSPRELFIEYSGIIRELIFGKDYEGYEIPTIEQIKRALNQLEAEGKIQAAQASLIESYAHAIKAVNAEIPQAEIHGAHLAVMPIIGEEKAEAPAGSSILDTPPETQTPMQTLKTPEAAVKASTAQIEQEIKELFGKIKVVNENLAGRDVSDTSEKPEETLKAWETIQKNHVEIKEKPTEMSELLAQAAKNKEQGKADEKSQAPKTLEASVKPEAAAKPETVQKPEATAKSETPAKTEAPVKTEASAAAKSEAPQINRESLQQNLINPDFQGKPIMTGAEKAELPKLPSLPSSTITQVGEQLIARLETAKNGTTVFEMTLNPIELGKIAVKIVVTATGTAVEITAQRPETAQLLQNSADRIGLALDKAEAKLESFVVNVEEKSDYSEQQNRQNSQKQENEQNSEQPEEDYDGISFEELLSTL
jgi:flagellar hook-length control protein FliK